MDYTKIFLIIFIFIIFLILLILNLKYLITLKSNFKHRVAWRNCKKLKISIPIEKRKDIKELEKLLEKKLKKVLEKIHSGSILLIQNNSDPVSIFMRLGITGRFSHSAIILKPNFFKESHIDSETPLLWQAAGEKICSRNSGPDVHSLCEFLSVYMTLYPNCRYAIRNLSNPLNVDQSLSLEDFILTTIKQKKLVFVSNFEMFWCFYTETLFRFLLPLDPYMNISKKSDLTFCSKLITETYQYIGLVDKNVNSFATTPNYFSFPNSNNILIDETEIIFTP
ncbi:hypothetical protein DDB_G0279455 [Dictyostelium discoideum AX4]|uniref:Uncharacterized protein n=1 Tax=Dictyostelium discoideum TaxID=44689 RepID=Q54WT2_DICDI|nr:hypothetical protein DDB_G0279455 [Dictyostelium discoideum AX4]EAL67666.1 hypothetical protein DDB_G0279455 [Dictyostelium discoideum AX4]|eukprot:XP_641635.1 hypothetical protein DDB_G0279455 [Dictyostelium discoideum AX4]